MEKLYGDGSAVKNKASTLENSEKLLKNLSFQLRQFKDTMYLIVLSF